jgi:ABC-type uncharacterized transport system involved in gliding motility auxiliary subunit
MLVPNTQVTQYQENLPGMMQAYAASGSYVLAARISGTITSPYTEQSVADSNIIIVADADLLHDHFWVNFQNIMGTDYGIPVAANGNFVVSALDNLSGSNALISIRNKSTFVRPFTTLQKIEAELQSEDPDVRQQADRQFKNLEWRLKFYGIGLVPLLIVVFGMGFWVLQVTREKRRRI